jgi:hypothetical protein
LLLVRQQAEEGLEQGEQMAAQTAFLQAALALPLEWSPLLLAAREQTQEEREQGRLRLAHTRLLAAAVFAPDSVWPPMSEEKKNREGEPHGLRNLYRLC